MRRLILETTPEIDRRIERLMRATRSIDKAEVIRKALALLDVQVDAEEQGKHLAVVKDDQIEARVAFCGK